MKICCEDPLEGKCEFLDLGFAFLSLKMIDSRLCQNVKRHTGSVAWVQNSFEISNDR